MIAETSAPASTLEEALKSAELEENVIANYKSQFSKLQITTSKLQIARYEISKFELGDTWL